MGYLLDCTVGARLPGDVTRSAPGKISVTPS